MKRKFLLTICFVFFIVFSISNVVMARAQKVSLNINGVEVIDQEPRIINQTLFLPIRTVSLLPNLKVDWDNETQTVFVTDTTTKEILKLTIGKEVAYKGDSKLTLNTPARIINSSTYVPFRFIGEALDTNVEWDAATKTVFLYNTDQNLAEAIKGEENQMELAKTDDVVLLANKQAEGGMFKEVTVQTRDKSKTFPWVNTSNPTYFPSVHITDVNADGRKEIVVILTTGTGTGVHLEEIHVLNRENLTEIIPGVENPFDAIYKKVGSKISKNNGTVNVVVEWDGKKIEKTYNESDAGVWNKGVGFGGFVNYQLHNNNIYAIVPGFATPSLTVVEAIVEYDSDFKARSITVKDIDEAGWPDWPDVIED